MKTSGEHYVIDSEGRKTAVIIPIERYEQMIEDLHDLAVIAERRSEEAISLEEMMGRLKRYGAL